MSLDYKHANEIIKKGNGSVLWLGDCAAAEDIDWIKESNIRVVITAAAGIQLHYDSTVRHFVYPIKDTKTQNIFNYFEEANEKIAQGLKVGSVLVHCGAGVSRSATLVLAYLISKHKMTFHEALKFLKARRSVICPNLGFQLQLKKYASSQQTATLLINTQQSFYKPEPSWGLKTFINPKSPKEDRFPKIKELTFVPPSAVKQKKAARVTVEKNPKPLLLSRSLISRAPREKQNEYIKKMAAFRFGITNTSKWGIY